MSKSFSDYVKLAEANLPKLITPEMAAKERLSTNTQMPKNQDQAYTVFQGEKHIGILTKLQRRGDGNMRGTLYVPRSGYDHMGKDAIAVGYDEPIVWDKNTNMWYAPADHD